MSGFFWGAAAVAVPLLPVYPPTGNQFRSGGGTTVSAGIQLHNSGIIYTNTSTAGFSWTVNIGTWKGTLAANAIWVQRVISSGALTGVGDPGSGRLVLSTSRVFAVYDNTNDGVPVSCGLRFDFYDAASGGSLVGQSGTLIFSASKTS